MKLIIYSIYDRVVGDHVFTFHAQNDGIMKRNVKSGMMAKQPNVLNVNTDDKDVYMLGEFETTTGIISPINPAFITRLEDLRQELLNDYRKKKLEADNASAPIEEIFDEN